MAVNPTGGNAGDQRIDPRAPTRATARATGAPDARALPRSPRSLSRLATAISESEIGRQIARLGALLREGGIDMNAPRGSYLNFLV